MAHEHAMRPLWKKLSCRYITKKGEPGFPGEPSAVVRRYRRLNACNHLSIGTFDADPSGESRKKIVGTLLHFVGRLLYYTQSQEKWAST
jgi:hypothetical protein